MPWQALKALTLLLLLWSNPGRSQDLIAWTVRVVPVTSTAAPKPLFAAVLVTFPDADLEHDRNSQLLDIRTEGTVYQHWMEEVAAGAGYAVTGLWRNGEDIFIRESSGDEENGMAPGDPTERATNSHAQDQ